MRVKIFLAEHKRRNVPTCLISSVQPDGIEPHLKRLFSKILPALFVFSFPLLLSDDIIFGHYSH